MSRDTGIADRLRGAGLKVVEVDGWQSRGANTLSARGSIDHHTAGPAKGNAPSLNICIYGRHDLPGPLCNVLIARDNTCFVVASGRANHAGTGDWNGLRGNSQVYGIERENTGYATGTKAEPWRPDQTDTAAKAHAALIRGKADASMVCRHQEWTKRKIDTHTLSGDELRRLVGQYLGVAPIPPPTHPSPSPDEPSPGDITMLIAIDSVGFYALCGSVLFTFRDMAAYGAAKNASPDVPALLIPKETPKEDRDVLLQNLVRQHARAIAPV